jgi:hypothetical protein
MAASLLVNKLADTVTHQVILEAVNNLAPIVTSTYGAAFSKDDIELIVKRLEERFDIKMALGTLFADDYRPWLAAAKGDLDWFYWNRYKRLLSENGMAPYVVQGLDYITDQILDHLENPKKEGKWSRKGMVVGHVQSGKTANYIGVVNKAADSGYRVIIVLAGTLNSLRSQTQERVDSGFLGIDTAIPQKPYIGVGLLARDKSPAYFTTSISDFKRSIANNIGVGIKGLKEPAVLVIKKNPSTLANLIDWLKYHNRHNLKDYPMLLIDDEADYASINTSKSGDKVTAINGKIRELLQLFDQSSYVGYTATPFANVFIDPATVDEMIGDDLFPRDFIISMDPPTNYMGASRIFSSDADLKIVRTIKDYEDYIPAKHKIGYQVEALPPSCEEGISAFVLARAVRLLRGQTTSHNSMLINISRFTKVQSQVKLLVDEYVQTLRQAIVNYSKLSEREALASPTLGNLKDIWDKEFAEIGIEWNQVQTALKDAVSPVEVVEVNSSAAAAALDFSRRNYPTGRSVIAVGGLSLSRGLTLEGLTVSYFLRNSIMYDTLMQMGRWFGYRDGYEDICRIYMSEETASWYGYISDAMEELRGEFRRMKLAGMTPKDFGLAVRSHPDSLIVTARNKMRTGQLITREIDLSGSLVETSALHNSPDLVSRNLEAIAWIVGKIKDIRAAEEYASDSYLWPDVPTTDILDFVEQFQNHRSALHTETKPLKDYIDWLARNGRPLWDVLLVNPGNSGDSPIITSICGLDVRAQVRTNPTSTEDNKGVILNKRRVASRGLEKAGLSEAQIELAKEQYRAQGGKGSNYPDHVYRNVREKPLLMLHILDIQDAQGSMFPDGTAAYGISFPGNLRNQRSEKLVQYVVNTTWWNNMYSDLVEDDDDDLGVDE